MKNLILNTDSYKLSHFQGYPKGAEYVYSYAESRGGKYDATTFLGLQAFIKRYLLTPISKEDIDEAEEFALAHGEPFNHEGWERILYKHDGYLPLRIRAVKEGCTIPVKNILASVENTDPKLPWLTSYIETALMRIWYPITVATRIGQMKAKIKPFYDSTSDTGDMSFSILDFSSRGVTSYEASEIGGLAHLLHFIGSDNIPAVLYARDYYDAPMAAFSVPATEHSIMCSLSDEDGELEAFEYLIDNMMPENGILSVVSDTYNVFAAASKWAPLVNKIRAKNGTLVFRPDSGDMEEVLFKVIPILLDVFGYEINSKGYKVLRNVKVLQGDGIDEDSVVIPFAVAARLGVSADSIMTGSGGGLMQKDIDRDTCKFAFKASHVTIDGVGMGIAKSPITDPGKKSKRGRLALIKTEHGYETIPVLGREPHSADQLRDVYLNGKLLVDEDFDVIRNRAK